MPDDDNTVSEVVVTAHSPGYVPIFREGSGDDGGDQAASAEDPKYQPPTFMPQPEEMSRAKCEAKHLIETTPHAKSTELFGFFYRSKDGTVHPSKLFSTASSINVTADALQWLQDNDISEANIVGEVHNHPAQGGDVDMVNRFPSIYGDVRFGGDWPLADQRMNTGLPGFDTTIIDPFGTMRTFSYADRNQYASLSYNDRLGAPDNGIPLPAEDQCPPVG